jgi:hypothetical protein
MSGLDKSVAETGIQPGMTRMRTIIVAAALALASSSGAYALTCKEDTAAKKLAGAAATSHMKKCESDARAKCEADSATRKLAGAAKTSHMKKCVDDAVGN